MLCGCGLWQRARPTTQWEQNDHNVGKYIYICRQSCFCEDCVGDSGSIINLRPWTQHSSLGLLYLTDPNPWSSSQQGRCWAGQYVFLLAVSGKNECQWHFLHTLSNPHPSNFLFHFSATPPLPLWYRTLGCHFDIMKDLVPARAQMWV